MTPVPREILALLLLGRTRPDYEDPLPSDGGLVSDVWLAFAADPDRPVPLLVAPQHGVSAAELGVALADMLGKPARGARPAGTAQRNPRVALSDDFVAAHLSLPEVLNAVLPLATWWRSWCMKLTRDERATLQAANLSGLSGALNGAVLRLLRPDGAATEPLARPTGVSASTWQRALDVAPFAAMLGLFSLPHGPFAGAMPRDLRRLHVEEEDGLRAWLGRHAEDIAVYGAFTLGNLRALEPSALPDLGASRLAAKASAPTPGFAHRVFLNRSARLALTEGCRTVKADAAARVFEVACADITWAVIDAGVARGHPAFADHAAGAGASRVRRSYDFTRLDLIRDYALTLDGERSAARRRRIGAVAQELARLTGRAGDATFLALARHNLAQVAQQLSQRRVPDWALIEPLLRLDDGAADAVRSDHGTHVAGILGADWREPVDGPAVPPRRVMSGVCPDIQLIDIRVLHESDMRATESAVLGALEFLRYLNDSNARRVPVVHGVNISLQIPYEVQNYGCGSTPICKAADKLASSGVVVVAAAGNQGWSRQDLGFGAQLTGSITDPGNARKVITVGSTHRSEPHVCGVSFFSSRGPTGDGRVKPDLLAPGERIVGPLPGGVEGPMSGTSMAAPFVSGVAAMLMARHAELLGDGERVKAILCQSATDLGRERYLQGHGLVDALRALQSV